MNLTADSLYDTITEKVVFEGENMLARFHDENSMYLYCVTDRSTANIIINNRCSYPIKLYENPYIANKVVENTNISNKVTLRFAMPQQFLRKTHARIYLCMSFLFHQQKV